MREILASTRGQVRAALTPDQQKLFDAMPQPGGQAEEPGQQLSGPAGTGPRRFFRVHSRAKASCLAPAR